MKIEKENLVKQIHDLKQEIDLLNAERPELHKFLINNRKLIRFFTIGFLTTALVVHATMPNIFSPETTISSSEVNANFAHLESLIGSSNSTIELRFNVDEVTDYTVLGGSVDTDTDVFLEFSNIIDPNGDITTVNGFNYFTTPNSGWYSIYAHLPVSFVQIPIDTAYESSNVTSNFIIHKGTVSGGVFTPTDNLTTLNNSNYLDDKDGNGVGDKDMGSLAVPVKTSTYLVAGEHVAIKATYRIHENGESITIDSSEAHVIIKADY